MKRSYLCLTALLILFLTTIGINAQDNSEVQEFYGAVSPNNEFVYFDLFDMQAGTILYIYAESDAIDTMIAVCDITCEEVFEDNDDIDFNAGNYNSALAFTFPADGDYSIAVTDCCDETASGEFRLLLGFNAPDVLNGTAVPTGAEIAVPYEVVSPPISIQNASQVDMIALFDTEMGGMSALAYSPDGSLLAVGGWGSEVQLLDAATGETSLTLDDQATSINSVAFNPDGTLLAVGECTVRDPYCITGVIVLWDITTGEPVHRFEGHTNIISEVDFSPDGMLLASASYDGTIRLWDVATGDSLYTLGDYVVVDSLAFSPDGTIIAAAECLTGEDQNRCTSVGIELWDVETGQSVRLLEGGTSRIFNVVSSLDGSWLASSNRGMVQLWDSMTGDMLQEMDSSWVDDLIISPDGSLLAASGCASYSGSDCSQGHVTLWDAITGNELHKWEWGSSAWGYNLAFSPDGSRLAVGTGRILRLLGVVENDGAVDSEAAIPALPDGLRLYVCQLAPDGSGIARPKFLGESCEHPAFGQHIFYPQYPESRDFPYTLTGDINGTSYLFNTWFASGGSTTLSIEIVLQQGDTETILASTTITSDSTQFSEFSEIMTGSDPETVAGDVLILRITAIGGVDGAIAVNDDPDETTFLQIPPIVAP